jgi:RNA polymerase sigma-70 factor, ECF subfamily
MDSSEPHAGSGGIDWSAVVDQIRKGDPAGEEVLYRNLASGARLFLQRRLGTADVEDRVHDVFVIVVSAIRNGELREPERLMGFVRTVLYRQLSQGIAGLIRTRETSATLESVAQLSGAEPNPEQQVWALQKIELMKRAIRKMRARDFEVLTRYYIREQPAEQICAELGLTQVQFLLIKSRAKGRLTEFIRRNFASELNRQ